MSEGYLQGIVDRLPPEVAGKVQRTAIKGNVLHLLVGIDGLAATALHVHQAGGMSLATMHATDERVPVADLTKLTEVYRHILDKYFA
jgi:acetylornithine deacetylase/succinyl-diaminopimelate desuccinylase-like protein